MLAEAAVRPAVLSALFFVVGLGGGGALKDPCAVLVEGLGGFLSIKHDKANDGVPFTDRSLFYANYCLCRSSKPCKVEVKLK